MKEAVVAIEDQRFYDHRGIDFMGHRARRRAGRHLGRRGAGRLDDHPAVRQERARGTGQPHRLPEAARGGARLPPRAPVVEGQDPHRLPQQDLLRRGRLRDRSRGPHLLRLRTIRAAASQATAARPCCCPRRRPLLAAMISSPTAYDPGTNPEDAKARRNLVLQKMGDQGVHHPATRNSRCTSSSRFRRRGRSTRRPRTPRRPTSPPGCGSRSSTSTAPARRSAAACRSSRRSISPSSRQRSSRRAAARRPRADHRGRRPRQRRRAACGRWSAARTSEGAVQPRDQRPPPAGLLVQAVHAGHGAEAGPLDRRGLHVGPAGAPVHGEGHGQERQEEDRHRHLPRHQLRATTTSAPPRSRRPRPTPTTPSTPSSASRSARRTSRKPRTRWASTRTSHRTTRATRSTAALRALQPGADPRRTAGPASPRSRWPTPTTPSPRTATGCRARWPPRRRRPVGDRARSPNDNKRPRRRRDRRQRRERDDRTNR